MKLTVHLITWNGAKYVPYVFESLRQQTFKDWKLIIVDNASKDEMVEKIKKELKNFSTPYELIENKENTGFAPGHNQAFKMTNGEYFLLLNQDMYLAPDCLAKMVEYLDKNLEVAAVSPRLMRWRFELVEKSDKAEEGFSNEVDCLGLKIFRNRRVIEQCTKEAWPIAEYNGTKVLEVFGVSGAFPMLRRSAVNKIVFSDGNFLDESYHSYKEDVDLAYRLKETGQKSAVLLDTVAYHDRAGAGPKEIDDKSAVENKKKQPEWVRYHSYKNHLRTLYKNEYWQNLILDFPWILWYELKKAVWFLLFDFKVFTGLKEVWQKRGDLATKRQEILKQRKVNWRSLRIWWS